MRMLPLFESERNGRGLSPGVQRLELKYSKRMREDFRMGKLVSYVGNKDVPLLRLYRYKEAFAFRFVDEWLSQLRADERNVVLDPFCGMGTTLLASACRGIPSCGVDRLPIATFIAEALPFFFQVRSGEIERVFSDLSRIARTMEPASAAMDVPIMQHAFSSDRLFELRQWKAAIDRLDQPMRHIFLFLFFSIIESCSLTSKDGQFLRLILDKPTVSPEQAMARKVHDAESDLLKINYLGWKSRFVPFRVVLADTRNLECVSFDRAPTLLVTSPPYANRYDYTRTYCLELCLHFVRNFSELRQLRHSLLRSHIEAKVGPSEIPPHPAVQELVDYLKSQSKSLNNPRIPDMLTGYFVDMQVAIRQWYKILASPAQVILVVDNVRFQGQMLPVDLILSEMAEEEGFVVEEVIVARYKGNSSQQMGRFGRLPVRESIVVWRKQE